MGHEDTGEQDVGGGSSYKPAKALTLEKAIQLGEYDPKYLSTFPDWHILSPHGQLQYIKQGIDNRRRQLLEQWASLETALNARLKPHLKKAQTNVEKQLNKLEKDRDDLYAEYSEKF